MPKTGPLNRVGIILSKMFITKLIIVFAGVMPFHPVINSTSAASSPVMVMDSFEDIPDQDYCYDINVTYDGMQVNVSACGNTPNQALSRLGAAVRRLAQS